MRRGQTPNQYQHTPWHVQSCGCVKPSLRTWWGCRCSHCRASQGGGIELAGGANRYADCCAGGRVGGATIRADRCCSHMLRAISARRHTRCGQYTYIPIEIQVTVALNLSLDFWKSAGIIKSASVCATGMLQSSDVHDTYLVHMWQPRWWSHSGRRLQSGSQCQVMRRSECTGPRPVGWNHRRMLLHRKKQARLRSHNTAMWPAVI